MFSLSAESFNNKTKKKKKRSTNNILLYFHRSYIYILNNLPEEVNRSWKENGIEILLRVELVDPSRDALININKTNLNELARRRTSTRMQADFGLQGGRPGSEIVNGGARPARSDSRARSEKGIEEIGQEAEGGWFSVRLQRQTIGQRA